MKRRDFLKIFAVAPIIPVLAKADVIGPDITIPTPIVPMEPCNYIPEIWSDKLLNQYYRNLVDNMHIATNPPIIVDAGEVSRIETLIDPVTFQPVRMKRTKIGWVKA